MSLRDESRKFWGPAGTNPTVEEINAGSLQRIADATEKMAASYSALIADRDRAKREAERNLEAYRFEEDAHNRTRRRLRSLRGVITRMKKK